MCSKLLPPLSQRFRWRAGRTASLPAKRGLSPLRGKTIKSASSATRRDLGGRGACCFLLGWVVTRGSWCLWLDGHVGFMILVPRRCRGLLVMCKKRSKLKFVVAVFIWRTSRGMPRPCRGRGT
jgi:hypothetical protein